ncbi:hypothetical protein P7C70_g5523, partial [Phenoliferia sp. Uapishka_3]
GEKSTTPDLEEEDEEEEDEREAVLKDDDKELDRVFEILSSVHEKFYENPDRADVKTIIPSMKRKVLSGVNLVFSGIIALGAKPQDSDHWKLATLFGAQCSPELHRRVTHVVASQNGTAKVYTARRQGLPIVRTEWLLESAEQWKRLAEEPYIIPDAISTSTSPKTATLPPMLSAPPSDDLIVADSSPPSATPSVVGDDGPPVDMTEVDWDEAALEVDAFLNETDDEDDGGGDETDGNETDGSVGSARSTTNKGMGEGGVRKRPRASTDSEDDQPRQNPPPQASTKSTTTTSIVSDPALDLTGSPLQKRVRTSRSRKSKLKVSFPADPEAGGATTTTPTSVQLPPPKSLLNQPPPSPPPPDGYQISEVGSSVGDSDDDFGSMAAELEMGWGAGA